MSARISPERRAFFREKASERGDYYCDESLCDALDETLTAYEAAEARVAELETALHIFNRDCEDGFCVQCRKTSRLLEKQP